MTRVPGRCGRRRRRAYSADAPGSLDSPGAAPSAPGPRGAAIIVVGEPLMAAAPAVAQGHQAAADVVVGELLVADVPGSLDSPERRRRPGHRAAAVAVVVGELLVADVPGSLDSPGAPSAPCADPVGRRGAIPLAAPGCDPIGCPRPENAIGAEAADPIGRPLAGRRRYDDPIGRPVPIRLAALSRIRSAASTRIC